MTIIKEIRLTYWMPDPNKYPEDRRKFTTKEEADASGIECWRCGSYSVVCSRSYGCSVSHLSRLVAAAKETYPELTDEQISVKQYAGDRYARTYGIEFETPGDGLVAPSGWGIIRELERTF